MSWWSQDGRKLRREGGTELTSGWRKRAVSSLTCLSGESIIGHLPSRGLLTAEWRQNRELSWTRWYLLSSLRSWSGRAENNRGEISKIWGFFFFFFFAAWLSGCVGGWRAPLKFSNYFAWIVNRFLVLICKSNKHYCRCTVWTGKYVMRQRKWLENISCFTVNAI